MTDQPNRSTGWLVSFEYDLCFIINLWWIPLAFICVILDSTETVGFWQIYLLTTPHRWITPFLVAADPDRRTFGIVPLVLVASVIVVLVLGLKFTLGQMAPLILLDAIWNGWHFGSQHAGIAAVYCNGRSWIMQNVGKHILRIAIFTVAMRALGWNSDIGSYLGLPSWIIPIADVGTLLGLASVALLAWVDRMNFSLAGAGYVFSVSLAYSMLVLAIRSGDKRLILAMAMATACMHAGEYLAFIGYYSTRRQTRGTEGIFRAMATRWTIVMTTFLLFSCFLATLMEWISPEWFAVLNISSALIHYAFDGLIWRLRRPETAAVFHTAGSHS